MTKNNVIDYFLQIIEWGIFKMYCEKCGAQIDDNSAFCTSCGATIGQESENVSAETEQIEVGDSEQVNRFPIKKIITGVAIACVAAVVCFGGYKFISQKISKDVDYSKHPLIYVKDDEMRLLRSGKKESFLITDDCDNIDRYSSLVQVTDDGKVMFYADDYDDYDFRLYYRKTNQKTPKGKNADSKGVKIASGVQSFKIDSAGKFVIYKKDDKLIYSDLKDNRTISKDVSNYSLSSDGKMILFKKDGALYTCRADKKSEPEKVDSDVSDVISDYNEYQKIYYIKDEALYLKEYGKDKVKIAKDVVNAEIIDDTVFVVKADEIKKSFNDLFDDDCAKSDAEMTEPDYSDFRIEDEDSFWGYTTDYDAYYDARDEWYDKEQRDKVREYYKDNPQTIKTYTLYKINKNKEEKIDEGFIGCDLNERVVFKDNSEKDGGKIKLSEIESLYDARDKISDISENVDSDMYILKSNGKLVKADVEDIGAYIVSDDGKYFYCIEDISEKSDLGTLNRYEISGTSLGKKEKIRDDVTDFSQSEKLIFIYGDDETGIYEGGKYHKISDESISLRYINDGTVYYLEDYDYSDRSGDLYKYKNGKTTRIDTDVADCSIRSENLIYYVKDYSTKRECGDLYINKNKKAVRIDTDVSFILY